MITIKPRQRDSKEEVFLWNKWSFSSWRWLWRQLREKVIECDKVFLDIMSFQAQNQMEISAHKVFSDNYSQKNYAIQDRKILL